MLSSTIIDPGIADLLKSTDSKQHEALFTHLLRGLYLNGILLTDKHSILTGPFRRVPAIQQNARLSALLTSLIQDCSAQISTRSAIPPSEAIKEICDRYTPELIVTNLEPPYSAFGCGAQKTKKLTEYHDSDAESRRGDWAGGSGPFDSLGLGALSETLRRITATSKWIRLYDAYFSSDTGQTKRKRSLELILANWFQGCIHPIHERSMEIFCAHQDSPVGFNRLISDITELQARYPIIFEIKCIQNMNSILHARHIQTSNFAVMVDPGLDFFNSDDTLRHVLLKPARGDKEHLRQVRSLEIMHSKTLAAPRR